MDEVVDRIQSHPDVKITKSTAMLKRAGDKQDLIKKPRLHIIKSKQHVYISKISI